MNKVKDLTKCYSHEVVIHPGRSAFSRVWKNARARRGASSTKVRETSTWRID